MAPSTGARTVWERVATAPKTARANRSICLTRMAREALLDHLGRGGGFWATPTSPRPSTRTPTSSRAWKARLPRQWRMCWNKDGRNDGSVAYLSTRSPPLTSPLNPASSPPLPRRRGGTGWGESSAGGFVYCLATASRGSGSLAWSWRGRTKSAERARASSWPTCPRDQDAHERRHWDDRSPPRHESLRRAEGAGRDGALLGRGAGHRYRHDRRAAGAFVQRILPGRRIHDPPLRGHGAGA